TGNSTLSLHDALPICAGGLTRFNETGSGVLISDSGMVMTSAHVVNAMDEITVEGVAGEVVRAKIISSDAAADVSLLQLERVTARSEEHTSELQSRFDL